MPSETITLDKAVRLFLDGLETQEARLLSWGMVDGGFSEEEIQAQATQLVDEHDVDFTTQNLIEAALDRKLLIGFNVGGERTYRTRMAESVRLFARLRQLFPRTNWQLAPTLVADYRFSLRPRLYPDRNLPPDRVISNLEEEHLLAGGRREVAERMLLAVDGRPQRNLADFQLRATKTMLRDLTGSQSRGMIVWAPTGTGKTLAFYLPALTHIASLIKAGEYWSKILAVYPRNELLKDQLKETFAEARRINALVRGKAGRKILVGAYFGSTPHKASATNLTAFKWTEEEGNFICPFLPCPDCQGRMMWRQRELARGVEELHCKNQACGMVIGSDEIVLTRERMATSPPDIVFTTTETLNKQIGNSETGHVFGVGARRSPQIVLLDEVHTYSGVYGAQVAYLIRRWRHAIGTPVQFTGLSATLRNAAEFFGRLVGLHATSVEEISQSEQLKSESLEYQLALRGDPVSRKALLSTTIQSSILLGRVLDSPERPVSSGLYGSRTFVFTDDLDVTNRLYHTLLDAEGFVVRRGRVTHINPPLADLRTQTAADPVPRLNAGQSWQLCEEIGHRLSRPLYVGRTSSQDVGVGQDDDLIVATAALEVGYNDPAVGAVIQHKAPRDLASFVQRKGRAGRHRLMRPWTVVVLSDYGRDRLAYQSYDMLFDPILEERSLPIGNRYVLRIQAVFAFMDWVARKLRAEREVPDGSVWDDFSEPAGYPFDRERQAREVAIIESVLRDEAYRRPLEEYIRMALDVPPEEVKALMWEPPRPLMTTALPTLLRRMRSGWARYGVPGEDTLDYQKKDHPLPDFVPKLLFNDLNLPEVTVVTPPPYANQPPRRDAMGVFQAMRDFAPGRVSRRFGVESASASHWIPTPNIQDPDQSLTVESYSSYFEELGTFQFAAGGQGRDVRCVRPVELSPQQKPGNMLTTSNAFLDWRSQVFPDGEGSTLDVPINSPWSGMMREVRFYTHNQRARVEVRRFALGSRAELKFKRGGRLETYVRFVGAGGGNQAAVGFRQHVDGIVFRFAIPEGFTVSLGDPNRAKVRAFRTAYFRHRVLTDERLDGIANFFQRGWLYQIYLSTLTVSALARDGGWSLEEANHALQAGDVSGEVERVLDVIFQTLNVEAQGKDGDEDEEGTAEVVRQSTHEELIGLCRTREVTDVLGDLARVLWEPPDEGWVAWARQRLKATVGGAILDACLQLSPQADSGDLVLDLEPGPRPPYARPAPEGLEEVWVTESTLGGGGVIEEVVRRYASDPMNFYRLVESALQPSDFEIVDTELTRLLELATEDAEVQRSFEEVRASQSLSYASLRRASEDLRRILSSRGILVSHPVLAALNARVLRPGSGRATDEVLRDLIEGWRRKEEELGIEIDARVYAYVRSSDDLLDQSLAHLRAGGVGDPQWRFQVISGLLWPRGNIIRSQSLEAYNPFSSLPDSDRELLLDMLNPVERSVDLGQPDWHALAVESLASGGVVALTAENSRREDLSRAILDLVAEPVEVGFLHVYPQVEGVWRGAQGITIRLRLREALQ